MKVSVIIPVYNSEKYIKKCIDSLVNQKFEDCEFIFVDNASTDNSRGIIELYTDSRIKYYRLNEKGISQARNFGIEKSNGDYIIFVDSDDYVKDDYIEKMYNKAIEDDLDIVICDYLTIDYKTDKILEVNNLKPFDNTTLRKNPNLILDINLGPCNKIFKRELFSKEKFPVGIKYEDFSLIITVLSRAKLIGKLNLNLCYFTKHIDSQTTTIDEKVFDIFISFDELLKKFENSKYIKDALYSLITLKLIDYCLLQKYQKNKNLRDKFIDEAFSYLQKNIPNFRKDKQLKRYNFFKRTIGKYKSLSKLYCKIVSKF
ncbi:MAG: glycosyltransferase family 2 protein [bacterium]|nr:glycosyltransferase family 2 protein [bacterium]